MNAPRRTFTVLALLVMPLSAIAQLDVVSRNSELKFDGTNFGDTDQIATETALSGPFDANFGDTLLQGTPNGDNEGTYSMSQHDVVSSTLLQTTHQANCDIVQANGSPLMRLTGDFDVEFTVAEDTFIVLDGALSGSSNVAADPYTAAKLEIASTVGTPDLFNSLLDDFPAVETLVPGNTYRLQVDARATCNTSALSKSDMLEVTLEVAPDSDDDGLFNFEDNCVFVANPDQRDTDGDGIGSLCDPDLDNNCTVNFSDLLLFKEVFFSPDADADFDDSGLVNFTDLQIMKDAFFGPPGPSGVPNDCDT